MGTLEELGYGPRFSAQLALLEQPELVPARVVSEGQGVYHLSGCRAALGELSGLLRHELSPIERPLAGDWVAVVDGEERAVIHQVLERTTVMVRRAAGRGGGGQVVAANVDLFFVVTSANRDFNVRRLERYLTAVWDSGASPVIVLNKIDLAGELIEGMISDINAIALGVEVVRCSALTGAGLDDLRGHLAPGRTVALVGSSGVGKSSLINCLRGNEALAVRELRGDGKGRHTTTSRQLIELPGSGLLLDTPGMRELGLVDDDVGVEISFADIAALAEGCRFRDCEHSGEPDCAVEAAVEAGELDAARLVSYQKLMHELAVAELRREPEHAGNPKRRWKWIEKAKKVRAKIDPKGEG